MSEDLVLQKWEHLKVLVESLEPDVKKNLGGNSTAGVRARRGLRDLKKDAAELVKMTIELEKSRKE